MINWCLRLAQTRALAQVGGLRTALREMRLAMYIREVIDSSTMHKIDMN